MMNKRVLALYSGMAVFIAASFIVEALIPGIPPLAYLGAAIFAGAVFFLVGRRVFNGSAEVLFDERDERNDVRATAFTFRLVTAVSMLAGMVLVASTGEGSTWQAVGRTLVALGMAFILIRGGMSLYLDWKGR